VENDYPKLQIFNTRYTPQHSGVTERKNITIMNMSRSFLKYKNLSNKYWEEALACSFYILNWSPNNIMKYKFPKEAYNGMKSGVSNFKVFFYVGYTHVLEELRRKLDNRSEK
jgi:hypothetical protein